MIDVGGISMMELYQIKGFRLSDISKSEGKRETVKCWKVLCISYGVNQLEKNVLKTDQFL